jgi:hypothetical protein
MTNQAVTQLAPRASHSADSRNPRRAGNTQDPVQITYAQRHADAGVGIDVLRELMDHRKLDTTQGYYKSRELHQAGEKSQVARSTRCWSGLSGQRVTAA